MKLYELLSAVETFSFEHPTDREITGIASDSRRVRAGELFVCIRGLHADGHAHIREAVAAGAVAVMTERGGEIPPPDVPHIVVPSTRTALARLYHAWYGFPGEHLQLIAVTGTNGKTSVSFMLRAIWEASMVRCGLIGTVHCTSGGRLLDSSATDALANMTTPDPEQLYRLLAEMVRDGVETVILEATSHALALGKLDALHFDAAVFTNLTPEHLDFHGDMERYFEAKAKLFRMCDLAILNRDDPWAARLARRLTCRVRTCSLRAPQADYLAQELVHDGVRGVSYQLRSRDACVRVRCPIPGDFSAMNSLQAAALALESGKSAGCIHDAMEGLGGVQGRMERVRTSPGADYTVFIDYAHTPDALENLLRTARGFCGAENRLVLVFGCGGDRDRSKRPQMGRLAAQLADAVIVTSDNSRTEQPQDIIDDILAGMQGCEGADRSVIVDRREAITYAVEHARRGDIILLAGKGHETYEINRTGRHPFDERAIVAQAAARRRAGETPREQNE